MRRPATHWEKISPNHVSDKQLASRISNELKNSTTNNPLKKMNKKKDGDRQEVGRERV